MTESLLIDFIGYYPWLGNLSSYEYLRPEVKELNFSPYSIICTSAGIDPEGSGQDFNWGNETGINPGGSGDDFNWGN